MKAAIRSCPLPCWLKRSRRNRLFPRKPISRIKGNVHAVDIVHCLGHASSLQKPSGRISAGLCSVREFPKSVWTAATMKSQSSAMDYMNPEQFKSRMHSLAYGQAMAAAARDYQKEMLAEEIQPSVGHRDVDVDDLLDDPELERLHAERLAAMHKEAEKRAALQRKGHGELQEVEEGDFLEVVTSEARVACHFFHRGFERCKIVDAHLQALARKFLDTRFIKLSAPDSPFFTVKLGVKVLPCIVLFSNGVAVDRTVGFDEFGATDDFPTAAVERRLLRSGVVVPPRRSEDDSEDEAFLPTEHARRAVRNGAARRGGSDDEDSDFD